jgi:CMP-N-acetylneuraminic acid synthetase
MIAARIGSERLYRKNLRMLGDKPILAHAISTAFASGAFDRVVVNGDDPIFGRIAQAEGAEFYLRPPVLGASDVRSDDVVADFMEKHPARIVAWVNSVSPLQPATEVAEIIRYFHAQDLDSLITTRREGFHAMYQGKPVNFDPNEKFAKTQDVPPVSIFVYSVMMWRSAAFLRQFRLHGHAIIVGKFGTYDVSAASCLVLKTEESFAAIEAVYDQLHAARPREARYFA